MPDPFYLLKDILVYSERLCQVASSHSREEFESDWYVYQASLRAIEIIGEAVKGLPLEVRQRRPEIPWTKITRMRDIVAHHYFGIDNDAIWEVVSKESATLRHAVSDMLADMSGEDDGPSELPA